MAWAERENGQNCPGGHGEQATTQRGRERSERTRASEASELREATCSKEGAGEGAQARGALPGRTDRDRLRNMAERTRASEASEPQGTKKSDFQKEIAGGRGFR